jgi:serine/threonine protein kinase
LDNILLDEKLNPKIIDFGISSIVESGKKILDTGGTPAYLAPEVIAARGEVCFKSDIWSLGVLLYLLTFGKVPFKAKEM